MSKSTSSKVTGILSLPDQTGKTGKVLTSQGSEGTETWDTASVTASGVTNTPAGGISSTDVQAAINELDTEKQPLDSDLTAIAALTPSNDDIIQRKSGAWTNRTIAQIKVDLSLSGSNTGDQDLSGYVPITRTVASKALSSNITIASTDLSDTNFRVASIGITIDGGGSAITTGVKGYIEVPYGCTINRATLLADQSGSIVIDVWKDTYANYPPTVADTITASAKPTLSSAQKSQDSTLTGWTTSISAGDILGFNVDSATTVTRVHLILKVLKT